MTVTEAQARLGRDLARKSGFAPVIKAARAQGRAAGEAEWLTAMTEAAAAVRSARPVTEQDVMDAIRRPMPRPAVTKAAVPVPREHPAEVLKALKSAAMGAPVPIRPAHYWTGIDLGLLRESQENPDPLARENARAALAARIDGKG